MAVTAVVGANWGDEGKGKIIDALAAESDYVVRFQGGSNAGHTVINSYGKFALHLLPSGVFHPAVGNVIGPGVALDVEVLQAELQMLAERGVPAPRLHISDRAQIVLPIHRLLDGLEEERLGSKSFGSTRRGIAPFYADKYLKLGIQAAELADGRTLQGRLQQLLAQKNVLLPHLYGQQPIDPVVWAEALAEQGRWLAPYLCNTTELLRKAWSEGANILLEGQLGALRDPDHGIYPYSTSSSTLAGYAPVGAGLPPYAIGSVTAVIKAYSSCVGAGPFVGELLGSEGDELRRRGGDAGEYGATTGRPRRMGWFDAVATRYGCMIQGATQTALTNLDVLGYLDEIPVCTAYRLESGEVTEQFPATAQLAGAEPIMQNLPGWKCDISTVKEYADLPEEAKQYVDFVEKSTGVPVSMVSVGPRREQLIHR